MLHIGSNQLKSDHIGIEIITEGVINANYEHQLKSDHIGIEIIYTLLKY